MNQASATGHGLGILRTLFIVGFAAQAVGSFAPDTRLSGETLRLWLNTGGADRLVSFLDLVRFCFQLGLLGWGSYNLLMFVLPCAFAALAITHPRRWVFITGSLLAIYQFLWEYVSPRNHEIQVLTVSLVVNHIAIAMTLVGFWIKLAARASVATSTTSTNAGKLP